MAADTIPMTSGRSTALLLVAAFLAMPVAQAESTQLFEAERMEVDGAYDLDARGGSMLALAGRGISIEGTMDSVYGHAYSRGSFEVVGPGGSPLAGINDYRRCDTAQDPYGDCAQVESIAASNSPLEDVAFIATATQQSIIHIYSTGSSFSTKVAGARLNVTAADGAFMTGAVDGGSGVMARHSATPRDHDDPTEDLGYFASRALDRPTLVAEATQPGKRITIDGDFVVEIIGVHVSLGPGEYPTGTSTTQVSPGLVLDEIRFLRLYVTGASLVVQQDGDSALSWASDAIKAHGKHARFEFSEVVQEGRVHGNEVDTAVPLMEFNGNYVADARPQGSTMEVEFADADSSPAPTATMVGALSGSPYLWTVLGLVGAAALVGYIFRTVRVPALPTIEQALQAGAYKKAARLSTRILQAHPRQESAHLSRAIAWSRAGQHERIVKHVEPFLRRHEPSDGTIHYVLGLAYLDLGREDEARSMMAEAVTRTPSLLAEVEPGLRPSQRLEGHAYT